MPPFPVMEAGLVSDTNFCANSQPCKADSDLASSLFRRISDEGRIRPTARGA